MKRNPVLVLVQIVVLLLLFVGCSNQKNDSHTITTGVLFEEMIDMAALAQYPDPGFKMVQFSSYDHRSKIPGGPDWFANSDGFGGEPIPNFEKVLTEPDESGIGEYLMVDVRGPGAVIRLWTASISGKVRLYIDDLKTPLYEGEADSFFRRPYDTFNGINEIKKERFNKTIYQRDASYAPIPFTKRLRLVWIGNVKEIHFYQIQVRLYPQNTPVVSFSPEDIIYFQDVIDSVSLVLSNPDDNLPTYSAKPPETFGITLQPGDKQDVIFLEGQGAIEKLTLLLKADDPEKALRQTILYIIYDGYPWGHVQSPVGDFFGAAPGINPYQSLPFTVNSDGKMTCRFVMPFQSSLRIILENKGEDAVVVKGEVDPMDFAWNENTMHFRARWRVDHNIVASNQDVQDLPFLLANGKGVYVGTTSLLLNPASAPTPWGNWWGEGDEKVFTDDDLSPSIFGTGSEDYYNYSWSSPEIFYFPYCGQPRNDGPGNRGFVTNYRWHILDPVPFNSNIRFYMELFSHNRTPGLSYARIAYHYAIPGLTDDHLPIMEEDVRHIMLPFGWQPASIFGARNSVFYPAEEIITGKRSEIIRKDGLWAGGQILIWKPEKTGERMNFVLPVKEGGKKRITMTAALTPKSGEIKVFLDSKALSGSNQTIDLFRPYRTLLRNFGFDPLELEAGNHTLSLEYAGTFDTIPDPEIGIDFFWVQTIDN